MKPFTYMFQSYFLTTTSAKVRMPGLWPLKAAPVNHSAALGSRRRPSLLHLLAHWTRVISLCHRASMPGHGPGIGQRESGPPCQQAQTGRVAGQTPDHTLPAAAARGAAPRESA